MGNFLGCHFTTSLFDPYDRLVVDFLPSHQVLLFTDKYVVMGFDGADFKFKLLTVWYLVRLLPF